MSRHTDFDLVVDAEPIARCLRRQECLSASDWWTREMFLAHERASRLGLSTGPGEREGCSALATLDNSPGLVLSDGSAECEALRDAVDGAEMRGCYTNDKPAKKPRKSRKKPCQSSKKETGFCSRVGKGTYSR